MPERRRKPAVAGTSKDLPEPVWAMVASKMPLKDWAKASGTCRTTTGVQLNSVTIPPATPHTGVVWARRRMRGVKVLRVHEDEISPLADAADQGQDNRLKDLQQLEVLAPGATCILTNFVPQFIWLLSCAPKLRILSVSMRAMTWLPAMMQLKHLVLTSEPGIDDSVLSALQNAQNLQTLSLSSAWYHSDAPRLRLSSLPKLQIVSLRRVSPAGIRLPKTCTLHVSGVRVLAVSTWRGVFSRMATLGLSDKFNTIRVLPGCFAKFQGLKTVALDLDSCGEAHRFLSLNILARVQNLHIAGRMLYLSVPARVSWESVEMLARHKLVISFDDVEAFADAVRSCIFEGNSLSGAYISELCSALKARGIQWDEYWHSAKLMAWQFPLQIVTDVLGCGCGACMACLRASGVAEMPPSEWIQQEQDFMHDETSDEEEEESEFENEYESEHEIGDEGDDISEDFSSDEDDV